MSTSLNWPPIGGSSYSIPASGEVNWPALSSFLIALGNGAQPQTYQKVAIRTATSTPVTVVSATDCIVVTNLSVAGAVAVTLPAGVAGQWFAIIDGKGDAASNNITVTPNGSETINGGATFVIKENRGGIIMAFAGTNWTVISEYIAAINQGSTGTGLIVRQTSPTLSNSSGNTLILVKSNSQPTVLFTGAASNNFSIDVNTSATSMRFLNNGGTVIGNLAQTGATTFPLIHNLGSGNITSGTYTPTITSVTNITTTSNPAGFYSRVGDVVTVGVVADVTPTTAANTASEVGVSLPIASNFGNGNQCFGAGSLTAASGTAYAPVSITSDSTNDRCRVSFNATASTSRTMVIHFSYLVI